MDGNVPQDDDSQVVTPRRKSSPDKRPQLLRVLRARTRLLVCIATFPVYAVGVWMLLSNGRSIDSFMFIYMALWSAFALNMSTRKCPACGRQFFVKVIFLNLLTKRCVHCGLDLDATENSDEQSVEF